MLATEVGAKESLLPLTSASMSVTSSVAAVADYLIHLSVLLDLALFFFVEDTIFLLFILLSKFLLFAVLCIVQSQTYTMTAKPVQLRS